MSNTQKDSKLVVVKTPGVLKELGFITGPIIHPSRIKLAKIVAMVNNSKKVFEVNPDNPDEQIELTRLNATSENFKKLPSAPEPEEKVERIADTKGKTAEVAGLGTLDRRVIDPTYTPAADTAAAVETAPVSTETKAEEVSTVEPVNAVTTASEGEVSAVEGTTDESTEDKSVAEEESVPEASSDVEFSQSTDIPSFQTYYGKKNKKNRNKNNGSNNDSNFTAQ